MMDSLNEIKIGVLLNDYLYAQYDNLKDIFYNYAKPRYLLAISAIIGASLINDDSNNNLHLFSCVCLGIMLYFHDDIDNLSLRYEQDGIYFIINDCDLYLESIYSAAKAQYEHYKDYISLDIWI